MKDKLQKIAEIIQRELVDRGFVVHRYDAYSTNSIYLKLDYGVGNSIRISDHKGKRHLQYRYNVLTTVKAPYKRTSKNGYPMYFYNPKDIGQLIQAIVTSRNHKVRKNSQDWYNRQIRRYKHQYTSEPGFWEQAYEVKGGNRVCSDI